MKISIVTNLKRDLLNISNIVTNLISKGHLVSIVGDHENLENGDLCFYLSYHRIVGEKQLKKFSNNLVVHASNLPEGKGWSPLTWSILEGKNEIVFSLFEAVSEVDSGMIYIKKILELDGLELFPEISQKSNELICEMINFFMDNYPEILKTGISQKGKSTYYARRTIIHSEININDNIKNQFNLLRIVNNEEYPAFFKLRNKKFKLLISELKE